MKKLMVICMAIVLLASISISALADVNGFVSSPSGNAAPTVEEFTPEEEACTAKLVVTPFVEKETLPDKLKTLFDTAYNSIVDATDLTTLNETLKTIVADRNINPQNLAVSDLFDVHYTDCEFHEGHQDFDITLSAETLGSFVGLLHMNAEGVWEWVADAQVTGNGEHLKFSVEHFSPFAIVVDTTHLDVPATGDDIMIYVWMTAVAAAAFMATLVVFVVKNKKSKCEK